MLSNICLGLSLLAISSQSYANTFNSCFEMYANRGESIESAIQASECFLTNKAESIEADHWIAMAYIWVVLKTTDKEQRRKSILGIESFV